MYELFPHLAERRRQHAGTLSGGEQQMLAFARALMSNPKLICMDEPTMGLAPIFVERMLDTIVEINKMGVTVFMVEQNAELALSIATRGYVLQSGQLVLEGPASELLDKSSDSRNLSGSTGQREHTRDLIFPCIQMKKVPQSFFSHESC